MLLFQEFSCLEHQEADNTLMLSSQGLVTIQFTLKLIFESWIQTQVSAKLQYLNAMYLGKHT